MCRPISCHSKCRKALMALNRSDKSRILRRYFPGMTRNSEMSTEPSLKTAIFRCHRWDRLTRFNRQMSGIFRPHGPLYRRRLQGLPTGCRWSRVCTGWEWSSGPCRKTLTPQRPTAGSSSRWCSPSTSGGETRSGIARLRARRRRGPKGVSQRELAKRLQVSRWTIQQVDG